MRGVLYNASKMQASGHMTNAPCVNNASYDAKNASYDVIEDTTTEPLIGIGLKLHWHWTTVTPLIGIGLKQ